MTEPLRKAADASARASDPVITSDPLQLPAPVARREPPPWLKHRPGPKYERPLSPLQRRFVEEYLLDCNALAAARRAGYSERTAGPISVQLMAKDKISRAIREAMDGRSQRLRISADRVLLELARIAFSDIGRIIDWSGDALTVEPPGRLYDDDRAAISEITVISGDRRRERGLAIKVKLHDKQQALMMLARHLRLWGPNAIQNVESPSATAERIRNMIREKWAKLVAEPEEEEPKETL